MCVYMYVVYMFMRNIICMYAEGLESLGEPKFILSRDLRRPLQFLRTAGGVDGMQQAPFPLSPTYLPIQGLVHGGGKRKGATR